ncbi:dicer-like protein [Vairimorpha apis BRL 01]|nr:dicer-like protein [Vairimorpha apis BRL 01]
MIHPSFDNNIFGSERFQKLELIGDCFYDLKVSDYIYKKYTDADPYELHTHRKRLVNNYTFAMILFKTGLVNLAKTGLNETSRDIQNNKLSKCYSDIFESLAGAVVIDSDFSFESSNAFFDRMLTYMKENSRDC